MLVALAPARVQADEVRDAILLSVAAPAEESARLEAVTREWLEPLAVKVEVRRVPRVDMSELRRSSTGPYFARVWITLSAAGAARLYLEHGESDRLLVRDVPGDPNNPELVREELGHILHAAVEGLKAGEEVGEPRREALRQVAPEEPPMATTQEPPRAPAVTPRRGPRWRVGARYEGRWLGDGARFEDGPGIFMGTATRFGIELGGYYRRPLLVEGVPVGARLQTVSLRALLTFEPGPAVRLGAGFGADLVHVAPVASTPRAELTASSWRQLAFGRLQATYGFRPWPIIEAQLGLGVDVDLSRSSYVARLPAGETAVLDPSALRPFLSLGAALP